MSATARKGALRRALAAAAGSVLLAACRREPAPAPAPTASAAPEAGRAEEAIEVDPALIASGRIKTAKAERRSLGSELLLAGDVVPAEDGEADVGSLVAGRVATLLVAEGARVKRGQALAWIDAPEVGQAAAEILLARGRAALAGRKLDRQITLEKERATSQSAIDDARAEDQAARAGLAAARARMATLGAAEPKAEAAEKDGANGEAGVMRVGSRVSVRAPIDGVVVTRSAVLGAAVSPSSSLFRLIDPDRLLVRARLPEAASIGIALDPASTQAEVRPRAGGGQDAPRCAAAVLSSFAPVDEATRTLPVRLRPTEGCPWLRPGAFVNVVLRAASSPAAASPGAGVVVPAEAVVDVRGAPTVFVAGGAPNTFVPRKVRVGPITSASAPIEAGVEEGEMVVTAGALLLKGELLRSVLGGE